MPHRVMAEAGEHLGHIQVSGKGPGGDHFSYILLSGGTGARATKTAVGFTAFLSGVSAPAEVIENLSPLIVEKKCLRDDSGGPGNGTAAASARPSPSACSARASRFLTRSSAIARCNQRPGPGGWPWRARRRLIDGVAPSNPKAEQLVPPGALVEVQPWAVGLWPPADARPRADRARCWSKLRPKRLGIAQSRSADLPVVRSDLSARCRALCTRALALSVDDSDSPH